jgi:ABC-2 type transport system ATP-binding protein
MSIIEVRSLFKSFNGKEVLRGIDLTVEKGEIFGFLGPNGAGKTTTMRIILGLLNPDEGSALVFGKHSGVDIHVRRKIGVLLEKHGMYETFSGFDNLLYYAALYGVSDPKRAAHEMLELTGLAREGEKPMGQYSSGMKKRLALARALVHSPELIFLDEPTSGLDPEAQDEFRTLVKKLSGERGITMFINSHNLDEVEKVCGAIAILDKGTIMVHDTISNLRSAYTEPIVDITFPNEREREKAEQLIDSDPRVRDFRTERTTMRCFLHDSDFSLKDLVSGGLEVEEFKKSSKTLEQVYLEVV